MVDCVNPYSGYLFTSWKIFISFHQTDPVGYTQSLWGADFKESHFTLLALLLAISEILATTLSIMSNEYRPDCSAFVQIKYKHRMTLKAVEQAKVIELKHSVAPMAPKITLEQTVKKLETVGFPEKPKTKAKNTLDGDG